MILRKSFGRHDIIKTCFSAHPHNVALVFHNGLLKDNRFDRAVTHTRAN